MDESDAMSHRRRGLSKKLALAAITGATAVAAALPSVAHAEPVPPPPPPAPAPAPAAPGAPAAPPPPAPAPGAPAPAPAPGAPAPAPGAPVDPNAPVPPPPAPADPNAPVPAPADPNAPVPPPAPEPGRVDNAAGGFSYVVPGGWKVSDATQLSYGQALLTKIPPEGTPEPPNDTSVLLGRLDLKLFAGAEADNAKAAVRLASDMGEFFMPFPGTRVGQETVPLNANGLTGVASYYEVKFTDANKPNGQIWAGVVGAPPAPGTPRGQRAPERWFVVWLGSASNPVDKAAAATLANSIRPWTPPAAPPLDPNAPPPPPADPNAPAPRPGVGVPVPVTDAPPEMLPPA
ncbi:alanine and proline-rich secreted protein Apa [Mycolicibacterium sp. HK-90]|uniref:alanine and proline-rich secreted protein Apa n=1 Tax=Mycolicibacterium sp. HK-90 TaxID=3056937 RepID=UPI0026580B42|nr:alanine and proline-rich secreted protein Apa [Mycolicibacterium sp. HK-90]WKG00994.1 alanine and proline-rich secreted protein Apa [Mycolicibacterium sp. HK-90]